MLQKKKFNLIREIFEFKKRNGLRRRRRSWRTAEIVIADGIYMYEIKLYPLNSVQKPLTPQVAQWDNITLNNIVNFFKIMLPSHTSTRKHLMLLCCRSGRQAAITTPLLNAVDVNFLLLFSSWKLFGGEDEILFLYFHFIQSSPQWHTFGGTFKMGSTSIDWQKKNWQCSSGVLEILKVEEVRQRSKSAFGHYWVCVLSNVWPLCASNSFVC